MKGYGRGPYFGEQPAPITQWAVIDRDSGEFFGRDLSYDDARNLAIQLGQWARVAAQTHSPSNDSTPGDQS